MTRAGRIALLAGAALGILGLLIAGDVAVEPWRVVALPLALGAVVAGIVELGALARGEWRRERPTAVRYLRVAALFVLAFLVTVVATL
jgi:hypothetical protein